MAKKLTQKQIDAKWAAWEWRESAKRLGDDIRKERKAKRKKKKKS